MVEKYKTGWLITALRIQVAIVIALVLGASIWRRTSYVNTIYKTLSIKEMKTAQHIKHLNGLLRELDVKQPISSGESISIVLSLLYREHGDSMWRYSGVYKAKDHWGKPVRLRRDPALSFYSCGPNGKDESGRGDDVVDESNALQ